MSIYVLVHGGFMGGWIWSQIAKILRKAGHDVFAPTLTGLGERAHLASPEINLNTHIQDIVGVLECEDLSQVILVGISYSSMVITGVAERAPERLSRLVYIDTVIPKDGQSWCDLLGTEVTQLIIEQSKQNGDGWRIPGILNPPRLQPHPLKTCTDNLEVKNPASVKIPRAFIHCTARSKENPFAPFWPRIDNFAEEIKQQGWWYRSLPTDHSAPLTMPKELAELLLELA
jgi:pimeloyl-ACP methyl ester carboxylesterase